jgi:hypothetical protein
MANEWEALMERIEGAADGIADEAPCRWFEAERCRDCPVKLEGREDCMEAMLQDAARRAYEIGRSHTPHARRLAAMQEDPKDPKHGTPTGYTYGCRCEECRKANSARMKAERARRKASIRGR